jgi:hypothetical protein
MIRPYAAKRPLLLGSIVFARSDVCPPRHFFRICRKNRAFYGERQRLLVLMRLSAQRRDP